MTTTIKFAKVRPDAKIPTKRVEDAGLDIYACFDEPYMVIHPHETVMIPTGIASVCDTGYCFILKERGSTGVKGMAQRSGLIDSGYRNEWFVPITNTTNVPIYIIHTVSPKFTEPHTLYSYNKAICQALVIPVPELDIEEYTYDELKAIPSYRGCGCLGSTNK